MQIITKQFNANKAAKSWRIQHNGDRENKAHKIDLLGANPPPRLVDKIIGNDSWTNVPACDVCIKEGESVLRITPPDSEHPIDICKSCLIQAAEMIRETN